MSWNILVMVDEARNHYKYWAYRYDKENNQYVVRYGRIGTIGVEYKYDADLLYFDGKVDEKYAKGYVDLDKAELSIDVLDDFRKLFAIWEV